MYFHSNNEHAETEIRTQYHWQALQGNEIFLLALNLYSICMLKITNANEPNFLKDCTHGLKTHYSKKCQFLPKMTYRFKAILIKNPQKVLYRLKLIIKILWKGVSSRIAKTILTKKNKVGGITYSTLQLQQLRLWHWQRDRHIDQGTE